MRPSVVWIIKNYNKIRIKQILKVHFGFSNWCMKFKTLSFVLNNTVSGRKLFDL